MSVQPKLWTKSFILLITANLFTFLSFQMLIPTMPPHIQSIGANKLEVGLVTTLFSIAAVLIRPYIGYLLSSSGRRPLVLAGTSALLLVTVMYPLTHGIWLFLLLRFLHGLAWGWGTTANGTAASDLVPRSRVGEGMGFYMLSSTVALIAAPSIGIYIFQQIGYEVLISVSAILGVIALILYTFVRFHAPAHIAKSRLSKKPFSLRGNLIDKDSKYPAIVSLFASFGYGSIVTFIVIFSEERGLQQIFLFYLFNALFATIIRPFTGRWFDKRGPWSLLMICSGFTFAGMWVLALAVNDWYLIIAGILCGAGFGTMIPAMQAWVLSLATEDKRGTANGMLYSSIDLGIGLSSFLLGWISTLTTTANLFKISSFCYVLTALLVYADWAKAKKARIELSPGMQGQGKA